MIVGRQIRAARALLDMSQDELAEAAGLTPQAIRKIESGDVQPREGTIADITRVFNDHRIEFTDNQGVRFMPEGVEVLTGKDGIEKLSNLIYAFLQSSGGVIRQNGIKEDYFDKCAPEASLTHRKRMAPLVQSRKDIFVRAILGNGDSNFFSSDYAEYKWQPENTPPPVPYYIFGDTVCIFALDANSPPKIILITSPVIAASFVAQFEETWEMAILPPKKD